MAQKSRKANGQGSTYKIKGTNSYRTVYRDKGRVVTATAKDRQTSRAMAKAKLNQLPIAQSNTVVRTPNLTLGEFLPRWLDHEHSQEIAHSTLRRYQSLANVWIIPALGDVVLRKLSSQDIKAFLRAMKSAGQSQRSCQQARALLCVALKAGVELNLLGSNPAREVPNIAVDKKPITPLTREEVKRLLQSVQGTFMEARLHLALLYGLRQGEAIGLRWSDIDLEKGVLSISQQIQSIDGVKRSVALKTASSMRAIVLADHTLRVLENHREIVKEMAEQKGEGWIDNDLLFPSRTGEALQSSVDYDRWHQALKQCGIARRSLHNARHTAGTLLYENNVEIETIRRILGHSSVLITSQTYVT
jgi:integrase